MAHLTNFSFEFFYKIFTEDASLPLLYHGAKKSKMTKNSNQGGGPALKERICPWLAQVEFYAKRASLTTSDIFELRKKTIFPIDNQFSDWQLRFSACEKERINNNYKINCLRKPQDFDTVFKHSRSTYCSYNAAWMASSKSWTALTTPLREIVCWTQTG